MKKRRSLLVLLPLALIACPEEKAPEASPAPAPAAAPVKATGPAVPAAEPSEAAKARAESLREQQPKTTTEVRAGWAMEACAAGCDEKQEAIATRFSAASQLVPLSRDGVPVGLQLVQLRAYSPWISCRLEPGDRVTAVEKTPVRTGEDIPKVIRACTLGQALTVERRGESVEIPARPSGAAPSGAAPSGAAPAAEKPAPTEKEVVPAGTRDLE